MKSLEAIATIIFLIAFCAIALLISPIGIFLKFWGVDCNEIANEMSVKVK